MTRRLVSFGGGLAALGVPVLVGAVALLQGYPLPTDLAGTLTAVGAGASLATLGLVAQWWADRGRPAAAAVAVLAVVAALAWSVLSPGVTVARVDGVAVVAGAPVLARFAGAAPWVVLAVGVAGLLEAAGRGDGRADSLRAETRRDALAVALGGGVVVAVLAVTPSVLLGDGLDAPALLGYALGGGLLAAAAVGYLFVRHRIVTPLLALGVVAAAAAAAVTAGGSPRGFPTAWPVWFVPGLLLGGVEALARRVRRRFGSG